MIMDHNAEMWERTGNFKSNDPMISLLYTLVRDGDVSPGRLEELTREIIDVSLETEGLYTNGYLARYIKDVVDRLTQPSDQ